MDGRAARLLWDAKTAAELIMQFTAGKASAGAPDDRMVRSAVERQAEVLGAALDDLWREFPMLARQVPDAARLVDLRASLIHPDEVVWDDIIWQVAQADLPGLVEGVTRLLAGP